MNMMMNNDGTVDFHATLFALVRTSLSIKKPDGKRSYLYFVTSWWKTSTCRRQKSGCFYSKFSVEWNELTPSF